MLEAATEYSRPYHIFCFKETDYVMKIMASWMTLDDLDGANTKHNYKGRDGQSLMKIFTYRNPFGLHFRYRHQVKNNNNRRQYSI